LPSGSGLVTSTLSSLATAIVGGPTMLIAALPVESLVWTGSTGGSTGGLGGMRGTTGGLVTWLPKELTVTNSSLPKPSM
jgi:hypothetical protein